MVRFTSHPDSAANHAGNVLINHIKRYFLFTIKLYCPYPSLVILSYDAVLKSVSVLIWDTVSLTGVWLNDFSLPVYNNL